MFTILPEFETKYFYTIDLGKKFIQNKEIIIVGLVRNLGHILYENVASIVNLNLYCPKLHFFLYENDSTDDTVSILQKCKKDFPNFAYQTDSLNLKSFDHKNIDSTKDLKSLERTQNLAKHRNICLNYVKEYFPNSDFTIVMDMDFQKFSMDGLLNSFGWLYNNYADALVGNSFEFKKIFSSNSQNLWNYDCWAYRGSWWEDLQKYTNHYEYDPMFWFGVWQPPVGSEPIQVNSAFGGIGIYKTKQYITVKYDGYDCEHVCLHKNLKYKYPDYKLCINPSQMMLF